MEAAKGLLLGYLSSYAARTSIRERSTTSGGQFIPEAVHTSRSITVVRVELSQALELSVCCIDG